MKIKLLLISMLFSALGWGQASLPTSFSGPTWQSALPTGWTQNGFGTDYGSNYDSAGGNAGKMDTTGDALVINFTGTPNILSYWLGGNSLSGSYVFDVLESPDGLLYTSVRSHTSLVNQIVAAPGTSWSASLLATTQYVKFIYTTKSGGNVGIDGVSITPVPTVTPTVTSSTVDITATYGTAFTNYTITANQSPTSYTATGLPAGMSFNSTTGLISGTASVVGTFPVSISATNIIGAGASVIKNYIINPKPLTITGLTSANKIYDGTTTATLGGVATLSGGLVGADVVTLSGTPISNYALANVGGPYVITTTGYTLSGADTAKYTLSQPTVTNRSITTKPLTVTGITANNKVYDTTTAATLSGTGTLVGIVGADAVTLAGAPVATFATSTVGTGIAVSVTGYSLSGAQAGNYSLTAPAGLTANITIATQTITFNALPDRMLSATTYTLGATSTSGNPITYTSSNTAVATVAGNVVTMLSVGSTIFTASQAGTTNYAAATDVPQNQNIIIGVPEINIEGNIGTFPDIYTGDTTPSGLDNTLFAAQTIGASQTKGFRIRNFGGNTLNISSISLVGVNPGDFSITASAPYAIAPPNGLVNFTITFTPTSSGVRTAIVSIASNDSDENPYTFTIQGTGNCPTTTITATPASGPVATQVTITSTNPTTNNLAGATAAFGGISATVLSSSASQMVVIIPAGAGNTLTTTNTLGCTATLTYVITKEDKTSCQGTGGSFSDLIISEVYDSNGLNVWHMELYNPTASTIDLGASVYKLERYGTIGDASPTRTVTLTGTVASGAVFLAELGDSGVSCVKTFDFTDNGAGINELDEIKLTKNGVLVDVVNCPNEIGYTIKRILTSTGPKAVFAAGDWTTLSTESCTDLGLFPYAPKVAPIVNTQPVANIICSDASLIISVTATEGFAGGNALAYQWYEVAPGVATWTALANAGVYSGVTTASLTISDFTVLNGYQYYCQVRENTATCYAASNAVIINDNISTTWNGATWSNGTPTLSKLAIIKGNYNTLANGDVDACSVIVKSTFTATINPNGYFNIQNHVTVNGILNIQNNGSLVQINDAGINTGNISYERISNVRLQDYVYWSSPVAGKTIAGMFPTSPYTYSWGTTTTNANGGQGTWVPFTGAMGIGTGYIVRAPTGTSASVVTPLTNTFTGVPNNGIYAPSIARGTDFTGTGTQGIMQTATDDNWNLLGNPYPSALDVVSTGGFLDANPQLETFVKIWTHTQLPTNTVDPFYQDFQSNYYVGDYATYNRTGLSTGPGDYKVGSGQGFMVLMVPGGATTSTVTFNNSMRSKAFANNQFYKSANASNINEKHRIWVDLVSPTETTRTLVGYVDGAEQGLDKAYDAFTDYKPSQNFYSIIDDNPYTIQGRTLPFDVNDKVPMGVKIPTNGTYTIAIAAVDGLFSGKEQKIYIEDKLLNTINDITASPYQFTATQGIINDRFVLRYTDQTLSTSGFDLIENGVSIFGSNNEIKINSTLETIKDYTVYNVLGQTLAAKNNVNTNQSAISSIMKNNQALIVKVILENGQTVIKKIIF